MPSCKNVPLISCVNITEHCATLLLYLFLKFVLALGSRRVQTGADRVGQQWMLFEISDQEKIYLKNNKNNYMRIFNPSICRDKMSITDVLGMRTGWQ